jgi:hypothetical protein
MRINHSCHSKLRNTGGDFVRRVVRGQLSKPILSFSTTTGRDPSRCLLQPTERSDNICPLNRIPAYIRAFTSAVDKKF